MKEWVKKASKYTGWLGLTLLIVMGLVPHSAFVSLGAAVGDETVNYGAAVISWIGIGLLARGIWGWYRQRKSRTTEVTDQQQPK